MKTPTRECTHEWADSINDVLDVDAQVTKISFNGSHYILMAPRPTLGQRQPTSHKSTEGWPSPTVPGVFPDAEVGTQVPADAEMLFESSKAYLPAEEDVTRSLSSAKASLPDGGDPYFLGSNPTNSTYLHDTDGSSTVDTDGHGASVPYTPARPAPHDSTTPTKENTDLSTTVHTGHSSSSIPPPSSHSQLPPAAADSATHT
ncbi:hypothetical protein C8R44DRAFT_741484 [Mycena epipterygia]|nr:hypothetical protein C8R44DRAFT_741484 [Mycena epipterygia]